MASEKLNTVLDTVWKTLYRRETLLWTPLLLDVSLALMTYPVMQQWGVKGYTAHFKASDKEQDELSSNKHVQSIWDTFLTAYTGYFGLLLSSTYCCYRYSDCRAATGYAMCALIFWKKYMLANSAVKDDLEESQAKENTLLYFYIPFYGSFCLLNLYDAVREASK
mmetsp:Transcript_11892/g.17946  ORF Transcript_11892/g.17946 Transcript_11892/m.17946 type:complete len:165 (+) Transcript_11892:45-539(+)